MMPSLQQNIVDKELAKPVPPEIQAELDKLSDLLWNDKISKEEYDEKSKALLKQSVTGEKPVAKDKKKDKDLISLLDEVREEGPDFEEESQAEVEEAILPKKAPPSS